MHWCEVSITAAKSKREIYGKVLRGVTIDSNETGALQHHKGRLFRIAVCHLISLCVLPSAHICIYQGDAACDDDMALLVCVHAICVLWMMKDKHCAKPKAKQAGAVPEICSEAFCVLAWCDVSWMWCLPSFAVACALHLLVNTGKVKY